MAHGVRALMPTNVTTFAPTVRASNFRVERQLVALQFDLATRFVEIVAEQTPFDTGHAQANWVASRSTPDTEENFDEPLGVDEIVRRAKVALARLQFGEIVYVQNNVFYISFLNDGSSAQAPAGFIEVALAIAEDEFRERVAREEDRGFEVLRVA